MGFGKMQTFLHRLDQFESEYTALKQEVESLAPVPAALSSKPSKSTLQLFQRVETVEKDTKLLLLNNDTSRLSNLFEALQATTDSLKSAAFAIASDIPDCVLPAGFGGKVSTLQAEPESLSTEFQEVLHVTQTPQKAASIVVEENLSQLATPVAFESLGLSRSAFELLGSHTCGKGDGVFSTPDNQPSMASDNTPVLRTLTKPAQQRVRDSFSSIDSPNLCSKFGGRYSDSLCQHISPITEQEYEALDEFTRHQVSYEDLNENISAINEHLTDRQLSNPLSSMASQLTSSELEGVDLTCSSKAILLALLQLERIVMHGHGPRNDKIYHLI